MNIVTHNKALTRIGLPEQPLCVLVPVNESQMRYRKRVGIEEAEDGFFFEDVEERVSVRVVSEDLMSLTQDDNRVAFEAKYGFTVYEKYLRDAFFCLMLAEAVAGLDPNRGVEGALRHYRGSQPTELLKEGSTPSRAIQQTPFHTLLEMLNAALEKTRLVVWWSSKRRRTSLGIYCPNSYSLLFALALKGMGQRGALGVCQRCGSPYLRSKRTQRFCSNRCQLNDNMRRYRERHRVKKHQKGVREPQKPSAGRRGKR